MTETKTSPSMIWSLPFFSDLSEQEKAQLLKIASFKHVDNKHMVFLQGDKLTHLYWICRGAVQMFRETPDGHELTESIRIAGDVLFDPDALQLKQVHTMNARAVQETTLLAVPSTWISENFQSFNHLANKLLLILSQRVQEGRIEAEHQATMNASQIVACFLQHLCVSHQCDPRGFDLPYSKSLIASRLGMELESLSRTLPKLRELGIIVRGKHVFFSDIAAAQRHACGACSIAGECHTHKEMSKLLTEKRHTRKMDTAG